MGTSVEFYERTPEEVASDRKTEAVIRDYLARPLARQPLWSDHRPIDMATLQCARCGVSLVAFHNQPIPCQPTITDVHYPPPEKK